MMRLKSVFAGFICKRFTAIQWKCSINVTSFYHITDILRRHKPPVRLAAPCLGVWSIRIIGGRKDCTGTQTSRKLPEKKTQFVKGQDKEKIARKVLRGRSPGLESDGTFLRFKYAWIGYMNQKTYYRPRPILYSAVTSYLFYKYHISWPLPACQVNKVIMREICCEKSDTSQTARLRCTGMWTVLRNRNFVLWF